MIASDKLPHIMKAVTMLMESYGGVLVETDAKNLDDSRALLVEVPPEYFVVPPTNTSRVFCKDLYSLGITVPTLPAGDKQKVNTASVCIDNVLTSVRCFDWSPDLVTHRLHQALTRDHPNLCVSIEKSGYIYIANGVTSVGKIGNHNVSLNPELKHKDVKFTSILKKATVVCTPINIKNFSDLRDIFDNIVTNLYIECSKLAKDHCSRVVPEFDFFVNNDSAYKKQDNLVLCITYRDSLCVDPAFV